MVTLISDGGTMTVGRRTANFTWGSFDVVLIDGAEQQEDDGRIVDGYIYRPDDRGRGRGEATFVRADARIDMNAEKSDLEDTLDGASKRTEGSVFYSREISGLGLGKKIPGADYSIGDVVNVLVWGKRIALPVTAVKRLSNTSRGSYDAVQVGGQALADPDRQRKLNSALDRQIAAEKRQRLKDIGVVDQKASDALAAASAAISSVMFEYAVGQSEVIAPSSGWSTSAPVRVTGTYLWQRSIITYGSGTVSTSAPVLVTGNTGASGTDGLPGNDGVGIMSTVVEYVLADSGTVTPTTGWSTTAPTLIKGKYLWTRTTWAYTDSTSEKAHSVSYLGVDGSNGTDGLPGKDGMGITSTVISYAKSASGSTVPTTGWQSTVPATVAGDYVWTRTTWTYSDSTSESGYSVGRIGLTGAQGTPGTAGLGIASATIQYAASTSGTTPPASGWTTSIPAVTDGQYLWTRTITTYTDSTSTTAYSVGKQGIGIVSVLTFYRQQSSAEATPGKPTVTTPAGWATARPAYASGQVLYRSDRTVYSDGTYTWSTVILDTNYKLEEITKALTGSVNGDMATALNDSTTAIGAVKDAATIAKQWTVDNQTAFNSATALALSAQQAVNDVNQIQWIDQTAYNAANDQLWNDQFGLNAQVTSNHSQTEIRLQAIDSTINEIQGNQFGKHYWYRDVTSLRLSSNHFTITADSDGGATINAVGSTWVGFLIITAHREYSIDVSTKFLTPYHNFFEVTPTARTWKIPPTSTYSAKVMSMVLDYKVTPGEAVNENRTFSNMNVAESTSDTDWKDITGYTMPVSAKANISLTVGWDATTFGDKYGIRILGPSGSVIAVDGPRNGVGPRTSLESGYRSMQVSVSKFQVGTGEIKFQVLTTADYANQRKIRDFRAHIDYIKP